MFGLRIALHLSFDLALRAALFSARKRPLPRSDFEVFLQDALDVPLGKRRGCQRWVAAEADTN
jgi:hypothetical protein